MWSNLSTLHIKSVKGMQVKTLHKRLLFLRSTSASHLRSVALSFSPLSDNLGPSIKMLLFVLTLKFSSSPSVFIRYSGSSSSISGCCRSPPRPFDFSAGVMTMSGGRSSTESSKSNPQLMFKGFLLLLLLKWFISAISSINAFEIGGEFEFWRVVCRVAETGDWLKTEYARWYF